MKRCLVLDVDGVVVNGRPEDGRSWAADIERDLGIDPARLQSVFFGPHWDDIVVGRTDLLEVLADCLPQLAPSVTPRAFVDYWFERDAAVDETVLRASDALRGGGMRVYLASNQEHMRAAYLMDRLALRERVDGMIHSAGVGARKPARAFFAAAERISGLSPAEIVLVDDTPANVEAARASGWTARLWRPGASLVELLDNETSD